MHWFHVSSGHGVCDILIYNIISHNFQFPFSFQDITSVCLLMLIGFNYEIYSLIPTKWVISRKQERNWKLWETIL